MSPASRRCLLMAGVLLAVSCGVPGKGNWVPPRGYAEPYNIRFEGAEQTRPDGEIEEAAAALADPSDLVSVRNLVTWFRHKTVKGGRRHFLSRDAALLYHDRNWSGCIDVATLFAAFTRSKELNLPTVFVHAVEAGWVNEMRDGSDTDTTSRAHTFLELYLDGSWYLLDPTAGKLYLDYDPGNENLPEGYRVQYKGPDMWGFGITNGRKLDRAMSRFATEHKGPLEHQEPGYRTVDLSDAGSLDCFLPLLAEGAAPSVGGRTSAQCPGTGLQLEVEGLLPVGPGGYVLVAVYKGGSEARLAGFNVSKGQAVKQGGEPLGVIPLPEHYHLVERLEVRYAPGLEGAEGAESTVLSGPFQRPGRTRLHFAGPESGPRKVSAGFAVRQTGAGGESVAGVQVETAAAQGGESTPCRLAFPPLSGGWDYELWLLSEDDGIPLQVSLGRWAGGAEGGASCDVVWLPKGSRAVRFAGDSLASPVRVLATAEPAPDPAPEEPFYLVLLEGEAPAGTEVGVRVPMAGPARALPQAVVTTVW